MKKISLFLVLFSVVATHNIAQSLHLKSFPLSAVRLLESPFYKAQQTDMEYILSLDADRLLSPFLADAGITPRAERYGNWENTGLDGHIGGHYLSALSLMYAATGNETLLQRLNYMVDQLAACQQKNGNGYVGGIPGGQAMWREVAAGNIDAGSFSLNHKWVPLYNIHKLYAGLRDAYVVAGNQKALDVLIKLSDWCLTLTKNLSDDQVQLILRSEHGGMNEVFADVAELTGDKKYLALAKRFSHLTILNPLLKGEDKLNGQHANTQIPKVIGYERVAEVSGDEQWAHAAEFFWQTVTAHRTVSIGGNSVREHFHPASDFSSMTESNQGPETCNTYNMLRLTKLLFLQQPDGKYMDYFERALYNHILSSQHPTKGGFVYFTPMRPRHYRVYSQPQQGFWCCVGSGLENHGKYGEMIYAHQENNIYINLFIASELQWKEKGITLTQQTRFPFSEVSELHLSLPQPQSFKLMIRKPAWVKEGGLKIKVNGKVQPITTNSSSYVAIERTWKSGDVVTVSLPMHTVAEYMPDQSPWVSFVHGPIVLAAVTDTTDLTGLFADDSRMGHVANGPLYAVDEAPVIIPSKKDITAAVKPAKGQPLTFTATGIIFPEKYRQLKLVPFFTIHEARYMVYWPVTSAGDYEKKKQALREKESAILALEARTTDQVATGEQQPESDHHFKGENTESGINDGRFWRRAKGWFSYELNNKNQEGHILRVTYSNQDKNSRFDIYLNNELFKTVTLDGSNSQQFFDVDYNIPSSVISNASNNKLVIKFVAKEGSVAGRVFYVRLLK